MIRTWVFLLAGYYEINVVESHVSLSLCWLNEIKSHAKDSFCEFKAHFSLAKAEIKTISNCGLQFPNCPLIQCNAIWTYKRRGLTMQSQFLGSVLFRSEIKHHFDAS